MSLAHWIVLIVGSILLLGVFWMLWYRYALPRDIDDH